MGVLLYIGFLVSGSMFNKLNKNDNTFAILINTLRMAELTGRPYLRWFPFESRFVNLSDITWKLNKVGWCLSGFFLRNQKTKMMGNEGKRLSEASKELSPEDDIIFPGLFISVCNEDSQLDFSEQFFRAFSKATAWFFPKYFGFSVLSIIKQ